MKETFRKRFLIKEALYDGFGDDLVTRDLNHGRCHVENLAKVDAKYFHYILR